MPDYQRERAIELAAGAMSDYALRVEVVAWPELAKRAIEAYERGFTLVGYVDERACQPEARAITMAPPDSHDVALALEALVYTQCPAYDGKGVCQSGCHSEPYCQTGEPTEGWIPYAIALLAGEEDDD